jgi:cytochrome b561
MTDAAADGRYVAPARWLHWLTAGSILVILVTGIWFAYLEPPDALKFRLFVIHESFGVVVFFFALARLWVRRRNPPPPLPDSMPGWQKLAAGVNHGALYVVMVVQPITGFLASNAWGFPLKWFWLVTIPSPIGRHETLAPILGQMHYIGAIAMVVLLGMHVGAVIQHTFIKKDGLWARMA